MFFPIPIVILILEWSGSIRKNYKHLNNIGVISLIFSALVVFAYATNAYEAIHSWNENTMDFLIWFGWICGLLLVYGILSGIYRIKYSRKKTVDLQKSLVEAKVKR